jgi:hypothetical protein
MKWLNTDGYGKLFYRNADVSAASTVGMGLPNWQGGGYRVSDARLTTRVKVRDPSVQVQNYLNGEGANTRSFGYYATYSAGVGTLTYTKFTNGVAQKVLAGTFTWDTNGYHTIDWTHFLGRDLIVVANSNNTVRTVIVDTTNSYERDTTEEYAPANGFYWVGGGAAGRSATNRLLLDYWRIYKPLYYRVPIR